MLNLREIRLKKKLSQMKLSELTGLTQAYLSELEHGKKTPSLDTLIKLANVCGCTIDELLKAG